MGVTLQDIDQDLAKSFNLKNGDGVLITEVVGDSPAEKAGLKQGDVILQLNGERIRSLGAFRNKIALMRPDSKIQLLVDRDGKKLDLELTIGIRPDSLEAMGSQSNKLGIEVEEMTDELAQRYGYKSKESGVIVTKVAPGSIAAEEGIKPGTIILSVNKQPVSSVIQFHSLMKDAAANNHVLLLLKQGPFTRFLAIKINE
jgi:serine protease Do